MVLQNMAKGNNVKSVHTDQRSLAVITVSNKGHQFLLKGRKLTTKSETVFQAQGEQNKWLKWMKLQMEK